MQQIQLGTWSLLLLLASLHGVLAAGFLLASTANRTANRVLAALLVVVVVKITPYTIGYAGVYDAFPWLTFAPFFWELAIGPLVWLYVRQLSHARLPRGWAWHLLPAALQGAYYVRQFVRPLSDKWAYEASAHLPYVEPVETTAILVSLLTYLALAWREYRRYQAWLEQHSAAREEWRLAWLRGFLAAMLLATLLFGGFVAAGWVSGGLTYFQEFPLYVGLAALVYVLGLQGWRHAADARPRVDMPTPPGAGQAGVASADTPRRVPVVAKPSTETNLNDARPNIESAKGAGVGRLPSIDAALPEPFASPAPAASSVRPRRASERDWAAFGARVRDAVIAGGWWREPALDLDQLARRLGTNTNYLSRALNEGLGDSFSGVINRLRVEAAQERLRGDEDVLAIGLSVGFGSKASFNRVFRALTGTTPTAWREARRPNP